MRRSLAVSALLPILVFAAPDAHACGGLFCSSAAPVNQAAERIVFAFDREAQEVTTVVEILYSGPAERFAWLLPVPGIPEVGVSTGALLNRLQAATNPTYAVQRNWPNAEACDNAGPVFSAPTSGDSIEFSDPSNDSQVQVVDAGNAGPYDYETLSVRTGDADVADAAVEWLAENDYDLGELGADVLRPYLEGGMNLLAIRLSKDSDTGAIRPLKLHYEAERPMIPIRPTAVAATDDMGVMVWVLGEGRAAPSNYPTLELNESLIDWFNPNVSYNDVVSAAANQATDESGQLGHGFVTEMAESTSERNWATQLYPEGEETVPDFRRDVAGFTNPEAIQYVVLNFTVSPFGGGAFFGGFAIAAPSEVTFLDGVVDVLSTHVRLPAGVSVTEFAANPNCYLSEPEATTSYCELAGFTPEQRIDLTDFDREAFLADVEKLIIVPLEDTAALFSEFSYVTRLYTTLSPSEMSLDPEFDLNTDLPDVSAQHTLDLDYDRGCRGDTSGKWTAELQGQVVRGEGNVWPLALGQLASENLPANLRVLSFTASGPLAVEEDNTALIADEILVTGLGIDSSSDSGCACTVGQSASTQGSGRWGLLGLLGAGWLLRRRRGLVR